MTDDTASRASRLITIEMKAWEWMFIRDGLYQIPIADRSDTEQKLIGRITDALIK